MTAVTPRPRPRRWPRRHTTAVTPATARARGPRSRAAGESLYFCPMCPGVESPVPGTLPEVRHGARVRGPGGDGGRGSRARSTCAGASWSRWRSRVPLVALAMATMLGWLRVRADGSDGGLDPVRARDSGRAVVRLAAARARRPLARDPPASNMFTLIGLGVAVAYGYQRGGDARAGHRSRTRSVTAGRRRSTSNPRR